MTGLLEVFETEDPHDHRLARHARGLLATMNRAGVLISADVHVAQRVAALTGEDDEAVALAVALAVRAARLGSVCVDLPDLAGTAPELPWPATSGWVDAVASSAVAGAGVVRVQNGLLYLDRYWREEGQVRDDLLARAAQAPPALDVPLLDAGAGRVFGPGYDEQRAAARAAAGRWTTVLTGGPGTGKTTAVAGLLALLTEQASGNRPLRVALAAPTGKAAARLQEAVVSAAAGLPRADRDRLGPVTASTLHRLLGWRPDSRTRFRHDRDHRLPHDVVVVDETSMVSLTLMARLLEAVRPDARLVLVGDPDQLASVEAGAVLADLVAGLGQRDPGSVVSLRTSHRFGRRIGELAEALRGGDADTALDLLGGSGEEVELLDPGSPHTQDLLREVALGPARSIREAAEAGDAVSALAAMDRHRLLCAHREGPYGAAYWNRQVERWLGEYRGVPVGAAWGREWYPGRPLLVTANDYGLELFNGDTGVVVADVAGAGESGIRAAMATAHGPRDLAVTRLGNVETLHATTVHKSQGGQVGEVTVLLPPEDSRLLTRELFYTAVTRAQRRVRVVGTEAAVRTAIARQARRASGLRQRLVGA